MPVEAKITLVVVAAVVLVFCYFFWLRRERQDRITNATVRLVGEGPIWRTKDGRVLLISQMDTTHLINTIRMVRRKGPPFGFRYNNLVDEARRRKLEV